MMSDLDFSDEIDIISQLACKGSTTVALRSTFTPCMLMPWSSAPLTSLAYQREKLAFIAALNPP